MLSIECQIEWWKICNQQLLTVCLIYANALIHTTVAVLEQIILVWFFLSEDADGVVCSMILWKAIMSSQIIRKGKKDWKRQKEISREGKTNTMLLLHNAQPHISCLPKWSQIWRKFSRVERNMPRNPSKKNWTWKINADISGSYTN